MADADFDSPALTETFIDSRDGTRLRTVAWDPPETPRARLLFLHGWAEYSDRYRFPVAALTPQGYACFGLDCRGHGGSAGRRGFIARWDEYLDDVQAWIEALPESHLPTFLIAHSQGGLVTTRLLETRGDQGLAGFMLSSPFLALARPLSWVERVMSQKLSGLWPGLGIPSGLDVNDISKDKAVVEAYAKDPLIFKKPVVRWAYEALLAQEAALADAEAIQLPCLVMHGGDDKIADPQVTERLFDKLSSQDKELKLFAGLRHEIFNEVERQDVFDVMSKWLEDRLLQ